MCASLAAWLTSDGVAPIVEMVTGRGLAVTVGQVVTPGHAQRARATALYLFTLPLLVAGRCHRLR